LAELRARAKEWGIHITSVHIRNMQLQPVDPNDESLDGRRIYRVQHEVATPVLQSTPTIPNHPWPSGPGSMDASDRSDRSDTSDRSDRSDTSAHESSPKIPRSKDAEISTAGRSGRNLAAEPVPDLYEHMSADTQAVDGEEPAKVMISADTL